MKNFVLSYFRVFVINPSWDSAYGGPGLEKEKYLYISLSFLITDRYNKQAANEIGLDGALGGDDTKFGMTIFVTHRQICVIGHFPVKQFNPTNTQKIN